MNGVSPAYAGKARAETESAGLGVIRGVEWTTFFGHILCLYDGAGEAADWRKFKKENFDGFAEAAREKGAVLIAAHPRRLGTPVGTGCRFEYNESCFKYFSAFEVWSQNEPNDSPANRLAVKMYDGLLCKGYKLAAVYGYDWHKPLSDAKLFANTYIGAENASPEALKDGLRRGDAYAALGISAELYADGERTPFGAEIERGIRTFELKIGGGLCPCPAEPRIFRAKGTAVCRMEKASVGAYNAFYGADKHGKPETACGVNAADFKVGEKSVFEVQSGWLRFEIFGADGKPLLSASPIYVK
ncbi:MAG: CehA/McbA family metallohydrolase [Clostridiales bacterium]|nr:CehA/McbA family metallohydrolase [Clostridiales bacterium]